MTAQYLKDQADRAERLARGVLDKVACEALMRYARECRQKALFASPFEASRATIHVLLTRE
jgi:hypothetical protein